MINNPIIMTYFLSYQLQIMALSHFQVVKLKKKNIYIYIYIYSAFCGVAFVC